MLTLGIDPGYAIVGWGAVQKVGMKYQVLDFGVITTKKEEPLEVRLSEVFDDITALIKQFKPDKIAIETLLFAKNLKTAMQVSESRGVIILAATKLGIPVVQLTPTQVKSSIAGYGKASKKQMQDAVTLLCNLKEIPKPDDAADAIGIAIAGMGE